MIEQDDGLIFRFDGIDAEEHKIELYALGESMQGLARIASVAAHFAVTQQYSRYFVTHSVRLLAEEPKANCFTVAAFWEFVRQHQIISGSFGAVAAILVNWVLTRNANKTAEAEALRQSLEVAIKELGVQDERVTGRLLETVERMAVEMRSASRMAVSPIGPSAAVLTVSTRDGRFKSTYNQADAEQIRKNGPDELTAVEVITVRLSELDTQRGTAKAHPFGYPEDFRVSTEISDPILKYSHNPYAMALASGDPIRVRAKLLFRSGLLTKIFISDVEA